MKMDCVMQANPNKISNYLVDLAPGSSIDLGNQNGYPRIAATAPGQSVVVAQVGQLQSHTYALLLVGTAWASSNSCIPQCPSDTLMHASVMTSACHAMSSSALSYSPSLLLP